LAFDHHASRLMASRAAKLEYTARDRLRRGFTVATAPRLIEIVWDSTSTRQLHRKVTKKAGS